MSPAPPAPPSPSPPPPARSPQHATAHAYANNGIEILQAATDAAQAIANPQALQNAAAAAAEAVAQPPGPDMSVPAPPPGQHPQHPPQHLMPGPGGVMRDPTINPKLTRLRRACDMCSMRKVKCDDSSVLCRPCRELGVDCTYERETKRRGPPNKHAEAAKASKRARMELGAAAAAAAAAAAVAAAATTPGGGPAAAAAPSPSPHHAAKALMTISSDGAVADAEAIAPLPVVELLVDDFFIYVHPLAPFPHEPTFRQSFANREDRSRPEFLGLLASMVAALVASFPRSTRDHLKAQHGAHVFPRAVAMVDKCRDISLLTRGPRWALKQPKTLDDAATSYLLGLASGYSLQWNAARHFMAETLTLMRELGLSRPKHPGDLPTFGTDAYAADPLPFNHVKDQMGKRIFWCLLLAVRSFSQLGAAPADLVIAPSTPSLPYPAYPENVDDICVLANEIMHQAEGSVTLLTGFRFAIDIYTTMNGVVSLELAYGMSTLPWPDQRMLLRDGLLAARAIVDNLPPELQPGRDADDAGSLASLDEAGLQYAPPAWPHPQPPHDVLILIKAQPLRRRQLQYEMQRANICVSQLATRAYFVELYYNLRDVHLAEQHHQQQQQQGGSPVEAEAPPPPPPQKAKEAENEVLSLMAQERELIVGDLLAILGALSQRSLEPNGGSLVSKLRQVAAALLAGPPDCKGPLAVKADGALSQFVDVLGRLERTGPAAEGRADAGHMTADDKDEELRLWADLRGFQLRYAANGAIAGDL